MKRNVSTDTLYAVMCPQETLHDISSSSENLGGAAADGLSGDALRQTFGAFWADALRRDPEAKRGLRIGLEE